jgi:ribonuclease HI
MDARAPHYLLYSQADHEHEPGRWKVALKTSAGKELFSATDCEPEIRGERLELLAVVRGLEALPHPARVTLVTTSRYVRRGLAYGLEEWRAGDWLWESYGKMVPVKHVDLWKRLDQALKFHQVEFRCWRVDPAHGGVPAPASRPERPMCEGVAVSGSPIPPRPARAETTRRPAASWSGLVARAASRLRAALGHGALEAT